MNGNCVLIPSEVATAVGNIDPVFSHSMGDFDYALRARRMGWTIWVAPGFVGICRRNPVSGSFLDESLRLRTRVGAMIGRKGLPPWEWGTFAQRYGGVLWPLYWASPYVKVFLASLVRRAP